MKSSRLAFSLVELSIVLVILGLLTGGILAGQSLIRAAELRAVSTEYARYSTAVSSFEDKYFAIPGDMTNATSFWGKDNTNCSGNTGTANATTGTCNGDGDGYLANASAGGATGELYQFWRQLANAGLIEGTYTGLAGSTNGVDSVIGTNVPRSKLSNGGWSVRYVPNFAGNSIAYAYDYQNLFSFGATSSGDTNINPILKPEEAWNLDTKMDDGKPGTGRVVALSNSYVFGNASACSTSANATDYTGTYNLSSSVVACSLYFTRAF